MLGNQVKKFEKEFWSLDRATLQRIKKMAESLNEQVPLDAKYEYFLHKTSDIYVAAQNVLLKRRT